ncbi:MAG TPA: Druantia anti-phage system protein DruA [Allosphingosinicella sp.]|nr:Druantia anti-phage system protein DruA [Allosphingosinicella sp.]
MARDDHRLMDEVRVIRPSLAPRTMLLINAFIDAHRDISPASLAGKLRKLQSHWNDEGWSLEIRGVALVLADLLDQGWSVRPTGNVIELQPPGLRTGDETAAEANERIREALRIARTRQLEEPGVKAFIARMERPVRRAATVTSIRDVIDDGRGLASELRNLGSCEPAEMGARLATLIRPEIEACDESTKCAVTGLRLMDVWRYFRHTWSLEYRSIPGRQIALLIRNAARPGRPVMGIAMLASPVVRTQARDQWIGWLPEALIERVAEGTWCGQRVVAALSSRIDASIAELRTDDLATAEELAEPSERTILRVEQRAAGAARARQRKLQNSYAEMVAAEEVIRSDRGKGNYDIENADLLELSSDPLFAHKRADTLWKLLAAKRTFQLAAKNDSLDHFSDLLAQPSGRRALSTALAEVRKAALASEIADLSVCGAAPPYNALLGGKLVALLMASEEVRRLYRTRYGGQPSVISSQMAGRLVIRPANLKVLTTTSLYGNNSSQYNRLRLRSSQFPSLGQDVAWQRLARTEGYGTFHLSPATLRVLREVSEAARGARWVNHRFGEGASPRMRQSREGLEALGIDSSVVLNHATPRLFYGCQLTPTAMEELIGLVPRTDRPSPSVAAISDAWRLRWAVSRVQNEGVLAGIEQVDADTVARDLASS